MPVRYLKHLICMFVMLQVSNSDWASRTCSTPAYILVSCVKVRHDISVCDVAGEQQRLGMARLFYACPRFGVLDECTNATSVDVEERLYRHANKLGITLATITQRAALLKYHDLELRLIDGEGT
jgi:ABC-type transport system involved in cytochrome c biogenesis ATPase subunit